MYIGCTFENTIPENYASNILSFNYTELEYEPSIPHAHHDTEIMMVLEGEGYLSLGKEKILMEPKMLYVVNEHTRHTELQKDGLKYFVVRLHDFVVGEKGDTPAVCTINLKQKEYDGLISILNATLAEMREQQPYREQIARAILVGFYYKLLRLMERKAYIYSTSEAQNTSSSFKEILDYISKNCTADLNLKEIAKQFSISQNTLTRMFKKHLGIAPRDFIMQKRISIAKGMLINTDFQSTQVATVCAFSDASYFIKQFKKHTGMTPLEYRKQHGVGFGKKI